MLAYLERKRFEARVLWAALGEALSAKDKQTVSLNSLRKMGFGVREIQKA